MREGLTGDDDLDNLRDLANVSNSRITRERDSDREAGHWCEELGEFIQVTASASREARAAAEAWVVASLKERGRQSVGQQASRPARGRGRSEGLHAWLVDTYPWRQLPATATRITN